MGALGRRIAADQQPHPFRAGTGQGAGEVGHLHLRRLEIFLPKLGMAWEAQPQGGVEAPLGGNGEDHGAAPKAGLNGTRQLETPARRVKNQAAR